MRPEDVITTTVAAAQLGVAVSTVQQWIERGVLRCWKTPGGHRRVYRSDVEHLLQRNETGPASVEAARLSALERSGLLGTAPEPQFDRLTWLATQVTQTPMAALSLVTATHQWFKSKVGLDVDETPRDCAFCAYTIHEDGMMIVEDTAHSAQFRSNPLVTGAPHIRFYAGIPVTDADAFRLGTLCVMDRRSRRLSSNELRALRELADLASEEIARRQQSRGA